MGGKFDLHTRLCEDVHPPVGRYQVLRSERCISCGECICRCIYGVHVRDASDPRAMAEPISHLCRACLVCPQQCPRRALEVRRNPALDSIGTPPFDADAVLTAWQEAAEGKIPVRGAGYPGPFRGEGFDAIWTDMSEIVRPTRDGIHGREYISTEFDLGRKLPSLVGLRFDAAGRLVGPVPFTREIPFPVLFSASPLGSTSLRTASALVRAAMELKTFAILDVEQVRALREPAAPEEPDRLAARLLRENRNHVVLRLGDESFGADGRARLDAGADGSEQVLSVGDALGAATVAQLVDGPGTLERLARLRERKPDLIAIAQVPAAAGAAARVVELGRGGVDAIELRCGWRGTFADGSGDVHEVTRAVREAHLGLVRAGIRDELTLLVSGGLARAEHLPKAILLGADAVVLDVPLLVAMGCRVCTACTTGSPCDRGLDRLDPKWSVRRIVNLLSAWRNQMLEVLGAMGLREVRRLRGEVGRGLFADALERDFLAPIEPARDDDRPLGVPAALASCRAVSDAPELMRNRFGLARVTRSEACARCGTCAALCPRGALPWPEGLRAPPPAVDELCAGPDCPDRCDQHCPTGALRIEPDTRLSVVENRRWTHRLIVETWQRAEVGEPVAHGTATTRGDSGGGFDALSLAESPAPADSAQIDLSLELNRRHQGPHIRLPLPVYGGGMSYGSVSLQVMLGRAMAASRLGLFTSTGEGGFPDELWPYAQHVITQVATGYFGVREETIRGVRVVELKYAQGAKPGLGGHLLGDKNTPTVARLREAVPGTALFSPFPFHSVYSIEDHRKHVDWIRQINPDALVSVKVSTPGDVDMVAVGSYHAGANIVHLDGAYGGTGAAPEVAKKNIAMPIELALSKTHRFLESEGIRDEIVLMASGGVRTPMDIAKAIALGADGVVVGTAELVAIGCLLCRNCEKDRGCPRGIATTDPELEPLLRAEWVARRIANLYAAWEAELRWILSRLGLASVSALRGRGDLLRRLPSARGAEP
jgi:glutamate synthase domain-containing protein 2/ferredoxin